MVGRAVPNGSPWIYCVGKLSQGYDCGTVPDTVPTVILPVHTCQVATTSCFVVDPLTEMTSHVDARSSPLV
eukprot:scaffold11643_cov239-Skeletonema_marinoi.AAC.1